MKIILVDTFGFFFRSYYALPPLHNSKHFPTSLLTGFANFIFNLYKDNPHTCIIFTLEGQGTNRRKEFYPQYKANRKEAPQDLLLQLPIAITWLEAMGLPTLSLEGYEADDCIATLATLAKNQGFLVEIISHDKDLYQLIDDSIYIFDYAKRQKITARECKEKFGVTPDEFITYQSIVGDTSDNIPGIKGIGAKGAQIIVHSFKTLESLYDAMQNKNDEMLQLLGTRMVKLISEQKNEAFLSRELVTLKKDLLSDFDFISRQYLHDTTPLLHIKEQLQEYELQKILQKIIPTSSYTITQDSNISDNKIISTTLMPKKFQNLNTIRHFTHTDTPSFHYTWETIVDEERLFDILQSIHKDTLIAFDCETNGLDIRKANMVGFSFCFDGRHGYYVPFLHGGVQREYQETPVNSLFDTTHSQKDTSVNMTSTCEIPKQISQHAAKKALQILFDYPLIGHNIKFDMHIAWHNFSIRPQKAIHDSMILAWLHDPNQSLKLDSLMQKHFKHTMIAFSDIVPKGSDFSHIALDIASEYASEDAVATYRLYEVLTQTLESPLLALAKNLEFPFIQTLCHLEDSGIQVNYEYFYALKKDFQQQLATLQRRIYEISGYEFNVNSTKQLSEVLFEKLKLDTQKKKKTGYSTDETTLTILKDSHPVIPILLEYREIFKLFSTYVEPILKLQENSQRIYTSFVQTGTNTGRLSSKSPNLQNIPVRSELGKSIRKGFEASDGKVLVSLDYSQIELRLLAHFSQDSVLVESFKNNIDIHAETAKRIFQDSLDTLFVQGEERDLHFASLRSIAKSINFGLIYGMGARKLAQTLQIPQAQAKSYIESYFANFPSVKQYLEIKKEEIVQQGFATTLLGRKRYFDFFNASAFMQSNYLREGVNTIFQGSAADIMKLSMNAIYQQIPIMQKKNIAQMLLQVHDELIFEIQEEYAKEVAMQIKEIMENVYTLHIPLVCNMIMGKTWADLK